jgi:hypothetical protein
MIFWRRNYHIGESRGFTLLATTWRLCGRVAGDTLVCPGSMRHSVSARINSLLSVAVSSEARMGLCTAVEFAGLVEAESGEDGDANRNGSCSNSLMLHWSGTIELLISIYSY